MISPVTLQKIKDFAYSQTKEYQAPSLFHLDYANEKGLWLAQKLSANKDIVFMGTLLMDCMLGIAITEGKISDHIEMSTEKTEAVLRDIHELEDSERKNIINCVMQHHGAKKFYSLEAEICCNADCYRFASVKGSLGGMVSGRKMELADLVKLYAQKADEKWSNLTLDMCKKDLEPQHQTLKHFLSNFK